MAQILQYTHVRKRSKKMTGRQTWVMAFLAMLSDCQCVECVRYREIARDDPEATMETL